MQTEFEKLGELIKDIRIAMVTTVQADGTLHTRPLAALKYENDGQLWFYTAIASAKVDEVTHDMRASVAFADIAQEAYVAASGTADIVNAFAICGRRSRSHGFLRAPMIRTSRC